MPRSPRSPARNSARPGRPSAAASASAPLEQSRLLQLIGYNCRRAYLNILPVYGERMARFRLRPAEYSVLVLIDSNPDLRPRRLGQVLNISPPNLATLLDKLQARGLIKRDTDPSDGRAQRLRLTPKGAKVLAEAEQTVVKFETEVASRLTEREAETLKRLLQKFFLDGEV
jgi:DNA-binding MarR family transcriptional regulator